MIDEGQAIVRACLRRNQPGPYQLQAAIKRGARRCRFDRDHRGSQILTLYDHLMSLAPTPVVALNRAIAVGEVDGPGAAIAVVDGLELDGYQPFHAAWADLLRRLHQTEEAMQAYQRAASLAPTGPEQTFLREQARLLSERQPRSF